MKTFSDTHLMTLLTRKVLFYSLSTRHALKDILDITTDTPGSSKVQTHPIVAMKIVVNDSEAFPGVVAPVSPAHQVLNNQSNINQSDLIVWRQMTLQKGTETKC